MAKKRTNTTSYTALNQYRRWRSGGRRLPFLGAGALLLAVAGVLFSVAILIASDGKPIDSWRFQPTVYLAIASTLTNITVTFALTEGTSIAWWSKALEDGTKIADLHRIWDFGYSSWAALKAGRYFNLVALASILVALSPINGPLLQRASQISTAAVSSTPILAVSINPAPYRPKWATGIVTTRGDQVSIYSTAFVPVVQSFYAQTPIPFQSACNSTCNARVRGVGFQASCTSHTVSYNISYGDTSRVVKIFDSDVTFGVGNYDTDPAIVHINTLRKPAAGCLGSLDIKNCTLRVGMVEYPISVDGQTSTLSLAPGSTIWDDIIVGDMFNITSETHLEGNTTYGGLYLALQNRFKSTLDVNSGGAIGFQFDNVAGQTANAYIQSSDQFTFDFNCTYHFSDPTEDILQSARDLMFRTAIASSNSTTVQYVQSSQTSTVTIFKSHYEYLGAATALSAIAILAVVLTFNNFWVLGRPVTLSPIETAKAFNPPLLRTHDSNATVNGLLRDAGHRPVRYAAIAVTEQDMDARSTSMRSLNYAEGDLDQTPMVFEDAPMQRLGLVDPSRAAPIREGEKYAG